jgi:glutamyl-tRNA reductase
MHLTLVGLSHKTAPIEIREKLTFPAHVQGQALSTLVASDEISEAVILSTCNRTEIYAVSASDAGSDAVIDFLCEFHGLDRHELARYLYVVDDQAVVKHLFRVVASLDSMVLGEAQILHQVKEAYDFACEADTSRRIFHKLFRQSFELGKRVRTETAIGESAVSISYAAVELAKKVFDTLEGRTILVVGAGKMSELTAKHLVSQGVASVLVANRTYERAVELAEKFEGTPIPYETLFERMREARRAEVIIEEEMAGFGAWLEGMEVVPTIAAIRARAEKIRQAEYERALKRLGGLSEKELATIEKLTESIVNKMLHDPTSGLREAAGQKDGYEMVETVRRLYALDEPSARGASGLLKELFRFGEKSAQKKEMGDTLGI